MKISQKALSKLPASYHIRGESRAVDMFGELHNVVIVQHTDKHTKQVRESYFDSETGEYISEV